MSSKKQDPVNPNHYKQGPLECIDVMRLIFGDVSVAEFCRINAFKYIWRHKEKNGIEDLNKAEWYMNKAMELDECLFSQEDLLENLIEKARHETHE